MDIPHEIDDALNEYDYAINEELDALNEYDELIELDHDDFDDVPLNTYVISDDHLPINSNVIDLEDDEDEDDDLQFVNDNFNRSLWNRNHRNRNRDRMENSNVFRWPRNINNRNIVYYNYDNNPHPFQYILNRRNANNNNMRSVNVNRNDRHANISHVDKDWNGDTLDVEWNERLLNGIQYVDYVSPHLICAICMSPVYPPIIIDGCGHMFCHFCINSYVKQGGKECPICRETISENSLKRGSIPMLNILGELIVKCPNYRCCQIVESRSKIGKHFRKCFGNQCKDEKHENGKCWLQPKSERKKIKSKNKKRHKNGLKPKQMKKKKEKGNGDGRNGRKFRKRYKDEDVDDEQLDNSSFIDLTSSPIASVL